MLDDKIRCMRCSGRKKMYKIRNIYCHTNTGGVLVDCPMCLGEGKVKTLVRAIKDIEDAKEETRNNIEKIPEEKAKRKYTKKSVQN